MQPSSVNDYASQGKPKRKQVKNACVNCQKACKKCDEGRPCQRCIKYALVDTCVDSVRKERKKGVKRGPYKKRKQESSAASTPTASALPTGLYSPTAGMGNVRNNAVPIHYQPLTTGHYDPFNAVSYQNSAQMMPQAYMMPAAIQQMYHTNPSMLSYQATMNMLSPQQSQTTAVQSSYRPVDQSAQQQQTDNTTNGTKASDSDEEGSKLTILSQLCSAVLDRNDPSTKQEDTKDASDDKATLGQPLSESQEQIMVTKSEPVPSYNNSLYGTPTSSPVVRSGNNSHYGTPGSSPSVAHAEQVQNNAQQSQVWPLPSLQSMVPEHMYQQEQQPQ
ncbi:hypothetical protein J3Q64DRAFT_1629331 [Phycomyces blakesleeanus]|uniref:Zn(2)-C6 fungal-type domain-containing protein n=1 Tax=Phycomyces blakesleeanus TaxID=4837 RepID=A0ABR3BIJ3_PHYBL